MKKLGNAIKIIIFFMLVGGIIFVAQNVTEKKTSVEKYYDFYQVADQVDVLFFGSSHMLNGINPVQLYRDYGITAYNMAKPGGIAAESYWQFMNALDYCNPKLVVVDLWALDRDYQYLDVMEDFRTDEERSNSVALAHENLDNWPISKTKIAAVCDLISDFDLRLELLWPFTVYHDRWSSLSESDFTEAFNVTSSKYLLGAEAQKVLYTGESVFESEDRTQTLPEETISYQYIEKMVKECKERGIEIAFTFMPMAESYDTDVQAVNSGGQLAKEYGLNYYWFLNHADLQVINFTTDMYDGSHLNNLGMYKMTAYIGNELSNTYSLTDHRGEAGYDYWSQRVSEWTNTQISEMQSNSNVYNVLRNIEMTASNVVIFIGGDSMALDDSYIREYIKQLSGSSAIDDCKSTNSPYLLVLDRTMGGGVQEIAGNNSISETLPLLGEVTYVGASHFGAIYPNNDLEAQSLLDMNDHYRDDMQILFFDNEGNLDYTLYFDLFDEN